MSIRDELLRVGFSDDYVSKVATSAYDSIVCTLPKRKTFFDTKVGKFLSTDWIDELINRLALYYYEKDRAKEDTKPEFTGDKTNPVEVYEYNAMNGIMPSETIQNDDGSYTHRYDNDITITVKVNLTDVFPEGFLEYYAIRKKRLIADYLKIDEDVLLAMSDEELEELVSKNESTKKTNKKIKLINK